MQESATAVTDANTRNGLTHPSTNQIESQGKKKESTNAHAAVPHWNRTDGVSCDEGRARDRTHVDLHGVIGAHGLEDLDTVGNFLEITAGVTGELD